MAQDAFFVDSLAGSPGLTTRDKSRLRIHMLGAYPCDGFPDQPVELRLLHAGENPQPRRVSGLVRLALPYLGQHQVIARLELQNPTTIQRSLQLDLDPILGMVDEPDGIAAALLLPTRHYQGLVKGQLRFRSLFHIEAILRERKPANNRPPVGLKPTNSLRAILGVSPSQAGVALSAAFAVFRIQRRFGLLAQLDRVLRFCFLRRRSLCRPGSCLVLRGWRGMPDAVYHLGLLLNALIVRR